MTKNTRPLDMGDDATKPKGKGRGRPPKENKDKVKQRDMRAEQEDESPTRADIAHNNKARPVRKSLWRRKKLETRYACNPDLHYEWVEDETGQIEYKKECGYDYVLDDNGQQLKRRSKEVDDQLRALQLVLMACPLEWYLEDQEELMEKTRINMAQMNTPNLLNEVPYSKNHPFAVDTRPKTRR